MPAAQLLPLIAIVWGALAFGAVYPWAYWPLAVVAAASGIVALAVPPPAPNGAASRAFVAALAAVAAAIVLQLVPLPLGALAALSPSTVSVLHELNPAVAAGLVLWHPVSLRPGDTATALALFACFATLLVGLARSFSRTGSQRFVEALSIFGVILGLIGIIQKPLYAGAIYGVWHLGPGRTPFGPFVNKNHFAGWMLMALPLTLALLVAGIDHGTRRLRPGWRYRLLWLSSPDANRLILIAGAATVMSLSLMLTMSRSGMTAFVLAIAVTGWFALRAVDSRVQRVGAAAALATLVLIVVAWTGPEAIASRFSATDWGEFNDRRGAWIDAGTVIRDFPVAGTGLNTYWAAALFYQRHALALFFAQAHNDYMQLAAEGGLLLGVPALVCLGVFVRDARRAMAEQRGSTSWWLRAGAVTSLVAIALQETVEFSLQMPGNAVLFAAVCAIALHREPPPADRQRAMR